MAGDNPLQNILGGAKLGATIGSVVPVLGTALGAGAGALLGGATSLIQGQQAKKSKQEAASLMPSLYDPMQLAMLAEIQQKRKSLLTGSAYAGQMGQIDQSTAGANRAIVQASGGDVGAAIQGLLQAQSTAARAKNQVMGQQAQQEQFYTSLGTDFANRVSDRATQLRMYGVSQNMAEWAQGAQDAYANAANSAARMDLSALTDIFSGFKNAERGNAFPSLNEGPTPEQQARALNPIQTVLQQQPVDDVSIQDAYMTQFMK